ncbi:MAG: hypothetical protein V6Z81_00450 [Parvularculales bacterium]
MANVDTSHGYFGIRIPKIEFSEWYARDDVKNNPHRNQPGVYIIARFVHKPEGTADYNAKEILCVGETTRDIHTRLKQFFRAAKNGKTNHNPGKKFFRKFSGNLDNIYVASFSPELEEEHCLDPFIRYLERKLILEYAIKHGSIPFCNSE